MRPLARLRHWWQSRRERRSDEALGQLKARYQTFRTLLDSNSQAVDLITELGMRLSDGQLDAAFRDKALALRRVVADMTDKFVHLEGARRDLIGQMFGKLAAALDRELEQLPRSGERPPLVLSLAEQPGQAARLGGAKALALARLARHTSFRVPDGFVLTAPGCRLFFDHHELALRSSQLLGAALLETDDQEALATACARLQELIRKAPLPAPLQRGLEDLARPFFASGRGLAVRSSAISEDGRRHSFAGQFSTVLNVVDNRQLFDAVREVLASAFSLRAIAYRRAAGLSALAFDMAVLCLEMIPARAAGIVITEDPGGGAGLLVSAVLGLGEAAVGGSTAADIFHLDRQGQIDPSRTVIARKEHRQVTRVGGGIGVQPVPAVEHLAPALTNAELHHLAGLALEIEALAGGTPQDIEWAIDQGGTLHILQARPLVASSRPAAAPPPDAARGPVLLAGGQTASRGRGSGQVRIVRRREDLKLPPDGPPTVLVLSQSLPDAAALVDRLAAIVVELGNPADHLSNVARERGVPMLCAMARATTELSNGDWVEVEADQGAIRQSDAAQAAAQARRPLAPTAEQDADPRLERCRALLTRLNLTDAYGPSFNVLECRSLHDLVRFIHEKAVLAMFEGSDSLLEDSDWLVHHLRVDAIPFLLSIIDLGGALRPEAPAHIQPDDLAAPPLVALWRGIATPGLHWGPPPGGGATGEVFSRWLTDHQSDRPLGLPNYLIAGHDYLNLNARMDFHFIMVDAVASLDPRANHIRFRFKGGGTGAAQRARRARCIAEILETAGLFTNVRDDLVGADLHGAGREQIEERLVTIGRLLGFTRLLDAAMRDEATAHRAAQAFLAGDYSLKGLS